MSKTNTGGLAFPRMSHTSCYGLMLGEQDGMTLRDFFAAQALMGLMSSRNPISPRFHPEDDAAYVYAVADAMLKARDEQ